MEPLRKRWIAGSSLVKPGNDDEDGGATVLRLFDRYLMWL
jgi:hypothetical protein